MVTKYLYMPGPVLNVGETCVYKNLNCKELIVCWNLWPHLYRARNDLTAERDVRSYLVRSLLSKGRFRVERFLLR